MEFLGGKGRYHLSRPGRGCLVPGWHLLYRGPAGRGAKMTLSGGTVPKIPSGKDQKQLSKEPKCDP